MEYVTAGYTGSAKRPGVTISRKDGNEYITLKRNRDYTVSYANNRNMGIATVTITGIGNYTGTVTRKFLIHTIDYLTWAKSIADNDYYVYGHNPPYTYSCSLLVGYALQNCGYLGDIKAPVDDGWLMGLKDKTGMEAALLKSEFRFIRPREFGSNYSRDIENQLKPGDIIWRYDYMAHTGFYMGNGLFIEARGGTDPDAIALFDDFGYYEGVFRLPDNKLR